MSITINGDTGIAGVDGSNTTPSLVGNDTNTGVFFPAADTVALATGGVTRFQAGPSGQLGIAGATYGTSGQVLTSGGASAAPSWTTISTGAWVVANSVNSTTSVATIDVTGLGSYRTLRITINNAQVATDGAQIGIRLSSDNGSTFIATSTYNYIVGGNGTTTLVDSATLTFAPISISLGNAGTDGGVAGTVIISNFGLAQKTAFFAQTINWNINGAGLYPNYGAEQTAQTAMNAIRFLASTGNITQAQILVEGWTGP